MDVCKSYRQIKHHIKTRTNRCNSIYSLIKKVSDPYGVTPLSEVYSERRDNALMHSAIQNNM